MILSSLKKVISSFFKSLIKNKKIGTYFFFFLISFAFWFLSMLSRTHETTLQLPIKYTNSPVNLIEIETPVDYVDIRVKAAGISIISFYLFNFKKLILNYDIANYKPIKNGQSLFWIMNSKRKAVADVLGSNIEIMNISPEKLVSSFANKISKELAVVLNSDISLRQEYWLNNEPKIIPRSVVVYGEKDILDSMISVTTHLLKVSDIYENDSYEVSLDLPNTLACKSNHVLVELAVEPFIEEVVTQNIKIRNLKEGYSMKIFPNDVTVTLRISKDKYQLLKLNFLNLYIDASNCEDQKTISIKYDNLPASVKIVRIFPNQLEYLLIKE